MGRLRWGRRRYHAAMTDDITTTDDTVYSWRAIWQGEPVISSDGQTVGKVTDVAALDQEDIFHGVVFEHHILGEHMLAPAAQVGRITADAVHLTVTEEVARQCEPFHEMTIERVKLRGLFGFDFASWKKSKE
jgi:hypothetical protein